MYWEKNSCNLIAERINFDNLFLIKMEDKSNWKKRNI